ncbi:hypothetical protein JOQ06_012389 [Pogonophryne albipinna]|uniref:Uncharacterized protein n=1 Tax=Pogonophryne albipinna TaxID=1090488 RepID=A0AAD6FP38_9TELE|nr:hypothetical protein JOQ06_012389 [Pogonophryne albipinna]
MVRVIGETLAHRERFSPQFICSRRAPAGHPGSPEACVGWESGPGSGSAFSPPLPDLPLFSSRAVHGKPVEQILERGYAEEKSIKVAGKKRGRAGAKVTAGEGETRGRSKERKSQWRSGDGGQPSCATRGAATYKLIVEWITPSGHRHCTPRWRSSTGLCDWLLLRHLIVFLAELANLPSGWEFECMPTIKPLTLRPVKVSEDEAVKELSRPHRSNSKEQLIESLLSGSRRDSSLIVTAGGVLRIRGQRGVDEGRGLRAGVGERMRGVGRVQNKRGGGEGVGEDARIEGGPMDEIGLAEKSPPETRGGEIANLDRRIKEVKSGSGGRDLEIGIRAGL